MTVRVSHRTVPRWKYGNLNKRFLRTILNLVTAFRETVGLWCRYTRLD